MLKENYSFDDKGPVKDHNYEILNSKNGGSLYFDISLRSEKGGNKRGQIECTDIDINIPILTFQLNENSIKLVLSLISIFIPSPSSLDVSKNRKINEKTDWEKHFNIDLNDIPKATLRTLLWLEKQGKSYSSFHTKIGMDQSININEEGIDFNKLGDIMKKYLLSKKSLQDDTNYDNSKGININTKCNNEVIYDSDSNEEFPDNSTDDEHSISDNGDLSGSFSDDKYDSNDDYEDSKEGLRAANSFIKKRKMSSNDNKPVKKMNNKHNSDDNNLDMSQSTYGLKSMSHMMRGGEDSEMFFSTYQGQKSQSNMNSRANSNSNYSNSNNSNQKIEGKKIIGKEMKFRLHLSTVDIHILDIIPTNTDKNNSNGMNTSPVYHELFLHSEEIIISTSVKSEIIDHISAKMCVQKESKLSISVALFDVKELLIRYDLHGHGSDTAIDSTHTNGNLNDNDDSSRDVRNTAVKDDILLGSGDESLNYDNNLDFDTPLSLTSLYASIPLFDIDNRQVIQTTPFLSFQSISDKYPENNSKNNHRTVISSPHMDIIITFPPPISICPSPSYTSQPGVLIHPQPRVLPPVPGVSFVVNLEPLIISVHLGNILRWKSIFDHIVSTLPPANSHTKMSMVLVIPYVDVYAHCDNSNIQPERDKSTDLNDDNCINDTKYNDHLKSNENRTYVSDLVAALGLCPSTDISGLNGSGSEGSRVDGLRVDGSRFDSLGVDSNDIRNNDLNKWITIRTYKGSDERNKNGKNNGNYEVESNYNNVRVISPLENEHQSSSVGGVHIQASQLLINIDTNNYGTKSSNMTKNYSKDDIYTNKTKEDIHITNAKSQSTSPSSYKDSTTEESLVGTKIRMEIENVDVKMFFAVVNTDQSIDIVRDSNVNSSDGKIADNTRDKKCLKSGDLFHKEYMIAQAYSSKDSLVKIVFCNKLSYLSDFDQGVSDERLGADSTKEAGDMSSLPEVKIENNGDNVRGKKGTMEKAVYLYVYIHISIMYIYVSMYLYLYYVYIFIHVIIFVFYLYKGGAKEGGIFDEMGTDGPGPARKSLLSPIVLDENTFYLDAHQIDSGELIIFSIFFHLFPFISNMNIIHI